MTARPFDVLIDAVNGAIPRDQSAHDAAIDQVAALVTAAENHLLEGDARSTGMLWEALRAFGVKRFATEGVKK